tara:strand:+ start:5319 stop:6011 length:693 start_codon:yes stop_codon:yes gene_type:complete
MISAFDQAFALLKMPIVPGSLRNTSDEMKEQHNLEELYDDFWEAQFEDPETGEIMPMKARTWKTGPKMLPITPIRADILNPANEEHDEAYDENEDSYTGEVAGHKPFTAKTTVQPDWGTGFDDLKQGTADWFPQQSNTQLEHRRKGYMTALYNMVQAILQREKLGKLLPSSSQSHQAAKFWDAKGIPDTELKPGSHKAQQQILAEHLDWDNYDPPLRWPEVPEELWQKEE